jgi:CRISPR-associated protein Cas6
MREVDSVAASIQSVGEPYVNITFPLQGSRLPADHGYLLYSAIARRLPELHHTEWLGIELISGLPSAQGLITLFERGASLRLRIPAQHYRDLLPLAGKRLNIDEHEIRLGIPVARPLEPAPSLYEHVVTIKKFTEPETFIKAVKRKLDSFVA